MNKNVYMILLATSFFQTLPTICKQKNYLQKIKSFFCRSMAEKVDQHEYNASSIESLSITNINGNISVHTGPKKSLFIKTTSRARTHDDLDAIAIAVNESKNDHLGLTTLCSEKKKKRVSVDYEVIVPAGLNVKLIAKGNGDIIIKNVHGTINATAYDNISITNTKKLVSAQTLKKGSITIVNSCGPVETQSYCGTITGENIAHNFSAHTIKGNIIVACKKIPSTGWLDAQTVSGNIILALPAHTNAQVHGHTAHGTFMSDHPILLKPYTSSLNKEAWNRFKKEVEGTLGTGEATIALTSNSGNIKIIETQIT